MRGDLMAVEAVSLFENLAADRAVASAVLENDRRSGHLRVAVHLPTDSHCSHRAIDSERLTQKTTFETQNGNTGKEKAI